MAKRMQSPSSINLYKQCPRKYYYAYILKLPSKTNIHLIRGNIVHSVLEDFFQDVPLFSDNYNQSLRNKIFGLFVKHWKSKLNKLLELELSSENLKFYFEETTMMISLWIERFIVKFDDEFKKTNDPIQAFKNISPITEEEIKNFELNVRGFIDAIHKIGEDIILVDYKTSKKNEITKDYKLQLAIYALLYKEKYGIIPKKVGIDLLKHGEKYLDVDEDLINLAKFEVEQIHLVTESNNIEDYSKKVTPLCKWSTGQCDFYEHCFK